MHEILIWGAAIDRFGCVSHVLWYDMAAEDRGQFWTGIVQNFNRLLTTPVFNLGTGNVIQSCQFHKALLKFPRNWFC